MAGNENQPKGKEPPPIRGTLASRLINPELFMKPNKGVMSLGAAAMVGCVAYILYMHFVDEKKTVKVNVGKTTYGSKWD